MAVFNGRDQERKSAGKIGVCRHISRHFCCCTYDDVLQVHQLWIITVTADHNNFATTQNMFIFVCMRRRVEVRVVHLVYIDCVHFFTNTHTRTPSVVVHNIILFEGKKYSKSSSKLTFFISII
jgi:hypothetical protein